MALRLKLKDGQPELVEADSPTELFLYQQLLSRNGRTRARSAKLTTPTEGEELPESARKLVRALYQTPSGMNAEAVAEALGVQAQGVGGFVTSLNTWGRRHGFPEGGLVVKTKVRGNQGKVTRRMKLADAFLNSLREGKIKGIRL